MAGHDVTTHPHLVRRSIGVAAQQATVDGLLSARANLVMVGRLYGLPRATPAGGPTSCSRSSAWPTRRATW